ncbi:hypothetical protein KJ840_00215 [Patescibacteria group bacterium]|nr:hypothetical protein [Patescibacteria group bacterium]
MEFKKPKLGMKFVGIMVVALMVVALILLLHAALTYNFGWANESWLILSAFGVLVALVAYIFDWLQNRRQRAGDLTSGHGGLLNWWRRQNIKTRLLYKWQNFKVWWNKKCKPWLKKKRYAFIPIAITAVLLTLVWLMVGDAGREIKMTPNIPTISADCSWHQVTFTYKNCRQATPGKQVESWQNGVNVNTLSVSNTQARVEVLATKNIAGKMEFKILGTRCVGCIEFN